MESLQPHIQLGKDLQIKYALMPGDPARLVPHRTFSGKRNRTEI